MQLGELKICRDNSIEPLQFFLTQVILGYRSIGLARDGSRPIRHAKIRGFRVDTRHNQFGGRLAMNSPMHLVLHRGKKDLRGFSSWVVIDARCVDVEDLPPEDLLRGADISDTREELIEIKPPSTCL
ncbi:hypothetical protein SDC9_193912 [bioreactor metagenome]|uniref:Uncharacterized protein n=1 Tax=bioreactor metagenome TaxID=1076179 RepID=A0A645I609_9ZZZZ